MMLIFHGREGVELAYAVDRLEGETENGAAESPAVPSFLPTAHQRPGFIKKHELLHRRLSPPELSLCSLKDLRFKTIQRIYRDLVVLDGLRCIRLRLHVQRPVNLR